MRMRITSFLVIMLISGCFCSTYALSDANKAEETSIEKSVEDTAKADVDQERKLIVYYFHGKKRCMSCRTIESYSHDAVLKYFSEEIDSGRLEFILVNFANPEYAHFKDDFELYTQSVVLVDLKDGEMSEWKNLKDVWLLTRKKDKFYEYIKTEVETFLKES